MWYAIIWHINVGDLKCSHYLQILRIQLREVWIRMSNKCRANNAQSCANNLRNMRWFSKSFCGFWTILAIFSHIKLRHLCTWTIPLIFLWTCKNVEWIINCIQFCRTNYNTKLKKRGLETHAKILSLAEVVMTLFRECGSPLFVFVSRINGTPACVNDLLPEIMLSFCVQDS